MKSQSFVVGLVSILCLSLTACVTSTLSAPPTAVFACVVQAETEVLYEIHLDGKLVSSGKTLLPGKGMQMLELAATPGDHVLVVTAPGCKPWHETIALMSGGKSRQLFRVELKAAAK